MGKRGKRYFSPEVKLEVIRRCGTGESAIALAEAYTIRDTLVHQWVAVYRQHGEAGLRGPGRPNRAEMAAKLAGQEPPEDIAPDDPTAAQRRIALLEKKPPSRRWNWIFSSTPCSTSRRHSRWW